MFKPLQLLGLLGTLLLFQTSVYAQESLSLEDALNKAENNNQEIKIKVQEIEIAKRNFKKTNSILLPKITLSETGMLSNDPLNAFGFLLQQRNVTMQDMTPDALNHPDDAVNWNTRISVEQPLFNMDGFHGRSAAKKQLLAYEEVSKRTKDVIALHVKQAYFGALLAQKQTEVVLEAQEAVAKTMLFMQNQYAQGYVKEVDLLKIEVRKLELENQLIEAQSNHKNADEQLAYLLGEDLSTRYTLSDELIKADSASLENITVSENRADLKALRYTSEAYEKQMSMHKAKFIPRINAFGEYNLNDTQIFGAGANSYLVGISLNWNVFNGGKNIASAQKAKAELQKSEMEYVQTKSKADLELNKAKREVSSNKQKIKTINKAIKQAEESYRLTQNLFEQGMETVPHLVEAEVVHSQKSLERLVILYHYYISLSKLELIAQ